MGLQCHALINLFVEHVRLFVEFVCSSTVPRELSIDAAFFAFLGLKFARLRVEGTADSSFICLPYSYSPGLKLTSWPVLGNPFHLLA